MSHFTVLVITPTLPSDAELATALQPFHEFECTGTNDQYVIDVDKTEEAMAAYQKDTVVRLKAPDGTLHDQFTKEGAWDSRFSQPDPEAPSYDRARRIEFVPPGWELVELPASEVEAACDWIKGYYGWCIAGEDAPDGGGIIEIDADRNVVKCISRTNPNKQWDWWTVGGRWKGMLRDSGGGRVDQLEKGDLAIDLMRAEARARAEALWDQVAVAVAGTNAPEPGPVLRERLGVEAARSAYSEQPQVKAIRSAFPDAWEINEHLKAASMSREAFSQRAAEKALSTFAFLKDGQWVERGEMGWFAFVSNEKDEDQWQQQFNAMIDSLPDTAGLTVVDCHI